MAADNYRARVAHVEADQLTNIVDARASDFRSVAEKTVMVDGLVARNGNRRVFPEGPDYEWIEDHAEELGGVAQKTLRGRRLEVFRALVIAPLMGEEKMPAQWLAEKFSVSIDRIYKDLERAKDQMKTAFQRKPTDQNTVESDGASCPTCGRRYDGFSSWTACERGYNLNSETFNIKYIHEVHSECLPPSYRAKRLAAWKKKTPPRKFRGVKRLSPPQ